jgi:hypothetical protein
MLDFTLRRVTDWIARALAPRMRSTTALSVDGGVLMTRVRLSFLWGSALGMLSVAAGFVPAQQEADPNGILLKDYRPVSRHRVPVTSVEKARFPVIDVHSHPREKDTDQDVERRIRKMDAVGVERFVVLTQAAGEKSDESWTLYSEHTGRFEL